MAISKNKLTPRMKGSYHEQKSKQDQRDERYKKLLAMANQSLAGLTPLEREQARAEQKAARRELEKLASVHLGNKVAKPDSYWRKDEGKNRVTYTKGVKSYGQVQHKV